MKNITVIFIVALFLLPFAHAAVFDYKETAGNTGYFFLQTMIKDKPCGIQNITGNGITVLPSMNVKGAQSCYNVSPTIIVRVAVDNGDYGLTNYATLGDYNTNGNHISVIPYHYNLWWSNQGTDSSVIFNKLIIAEDRNPSLKGPSPTVTGDIYNWVLDEGTLFPYYEWKMLGKRGVCDDHVSLALNAPNVYYSHPNKLSVNGFGKVVASNCGKLMNPPSGSIDRVNSMLSENPDVFHSLYYDSIFNYLSYPFTIHDIQVKCYNNGSLVGYSTIDSPIQSETSIYSGESQRVGFSLQNWGYQPYPYSSTGSGYLVSSPGNVELLSKDFTASCPVGTNFYTASVVISKNPMYRHISPVDATWDWHDVFDTTTGSALDNEFSTAGGNAILLTQTGLISPNSTLLPTNNTYSTGTNPDSSKVTETSSAMKATSSNTSGGRVPQYYNGVADCIDCQQNITGYGGNSTNTTNGGGGISPGGSRIADAIDDSAVGHFSPSNTPGGGSDCTGLMCQIHNQNQVQSKQDFVNQLIQLGLLIFTSVIVFAELFAIIGMILVFLMFFSIPSKMKEAVRELFRAGMRK